MMVPPSTSGSGPPSFGTEEKAHEFNASDVSPDDIIPGVGSVWRTQETTASHNLPKGGLEWGVSDLFLSSQNTAQTLGDEMFKLSLSNHHTAAPTTTTTTAAAAPHYNHVTNRTARPREDIPGQTAPPLESPSVSVTGTSTSSRSASPAVTKNHVDADFGRTINAYQRNDNFDDSVFDNNDTTTVRSNTMMHGFVPPQNNNNNNNNNTFLQDDFGFQTGTNMSANAGSFDFQNRPSYMPPDRQATDVNPYQPKIEANPPQPQQQQQQGQQGQQVLYMAMASPDGRSQTLHPVQMVNVAGQPSTFIVRSDSTGGMSQGGATMPPGATQRLHVQDSMQPFTVASKNTTNEAGAVAGGGGAANWEPPQQNHYTASTLPHSTSSQNLERSYGPYSSNESLTRLATEPKYTTTNPNNNYNSKSGGTSNARRPLYLPQDSSAATTTPGNTSPGSTTSPNDPIASLYKSTQRPPLEALLGHVRRLSRDQLGCRLLQQALDEEGSAAATMILNEGLSFWEEAMVDPFGNYLFQKILEKITRDERIMLMNTVSSRLVSASLNLHGTRSVQKLVELCAIDEASRNAVPPNSSEPTAASILTRALAPAAARLCIDSHGNHVIQRILLKLSYHHSRFVFEAVAASVGDVARHRHGCCVIQRCLDSPPTKARSQLVLRIVEKALELMQDAYGNYVVQYVLDVCGDEDVYAVCESVVGKVNLLAIQKFSSNVMEKCLERCTDDIKELYLVEIGDPEHIRELMMDPFGNYVVQRALAVASHDQAVRLVEAMRPHLVANPPGTFPGQRGGGGGGGGGGGMRNTAGGRRILAKICRRFPNFELACVGAVDAEPYAPGPQKVVNNRNQTSPMPPGVPQQHAPPYIVKKSPNNRQGNHHRHHHHHHHHQPQNYNNNDGGGQQQQRRYYNNNQRGSGDLTYAPM